MLKTKLIALAALAAFVVPTMASADAPKISYSAKKQGRVAFQERTQNEAEAAVSGETTDAINPADIEPAAGGFEPENNIQKNSVANRIKLPRKN